MCFPPWLPFLSLPPFFSCSPCKFEKASLRLATHLTRKNIYTHVCSQPYKSPGLATWQWESGRALFLPHSPQTASLGWVGGSFLTVTPTGASSGQRQPGILDPFLRFWKTITDQDLALCQSYPATPSSLWGISPGTSSFQEALPCCHHPN